VSFRPREKQLVYLDVARSENLSRMVATARSYEDGCREILMAHLERGGQVVALRRAPGPYLRSVNRMVATPTSHTRMLDERHASHDARVEMATVGRIAFRRIARAARALEDELGLDVAVKEIRVENRIG
jgi:hypothetical protein